MISIRRTWRSACARPLRLAKSDRAAILAAKIISRTGKLVSRNHVSKLKAKMSQSPYPTVAAGPPRPSLILRPGQIALPAGMERYTIQGNGAVLIEVEAGDTLTVRNVEGGQACELLAWDKTGTTDPGILGEKSNSNAAGIKALLADGDDSLAALRRGLDRRQVQLDQAKAVRVFGGSTPAGTEQSFTVARDGSMVIAAPGGPMLVDGHDTATPLSVIVRRATIRPTAKSQLGRPAGRSGARPARPFGDGGILFRQGRRLSADHRCRRAPVHRLPVLFGAQAGQGPRPSARRDDDPHADGCELSDARPAFEILRPGHGAAGRGGAGHVRPARCVRARLRRQILRRHRLSRPHQLLGEFQPRAGRQGRQCLAPAGWRSTSSSTRRSTRMASWFPTSRGRGRATMCCCVRLTDIVCVSSACPDDTTPANGWNLTDIHVRTYSGQHKFSRAIARRMTPDSEPKMTRETAFHSSFAKHTRNFVEYRGYWLANSFAKEGPIDEYWACRQDAVIMDLSPLRKFEVTGPDSEALLQYTLTRDVKKLGVGQVVYSAMCYEHGGMIDDGTLLRLGKDNFRWVGGDDLSGEWLRETAKKLGLNVLVRSSTDQMHNVAVQGPKSRDILQGDHLDLAAAAIDRGARMVPLRGRAHRRRQRHSGRRLAHRLHRRTRLRDLVPSARRRESVRRHLGGRPAARAEADGPAGARHGAHRGRADLRRLRVFRPDRSVRGRHRLHGAAEDQDRRFHRPRGADPAQGEPADTNWSASTSTPMSLSAMATASMSAAPRSASSPPACARRC